jgi:hypothetical protein
MGCGILVRLSTIFGKETFPVQVNSRGKSVVYSPTLAKVKNRKNGARKYCFLVSCAPALKPAGW